MEDDLVSYVAKHCMWLYAEKKLLRWMCIAYYNN